MAEAYHVFFLFIECDIFTKSANDHSRHNSSGTMVAYFVLCLIPYEFFTDRSDYLVLCRVLPLFFCSILGIQPISAKKNGRITDWRIIPLRSFIFDAIISHVI